MRQSLRRRALLWYYALLACALMILGTWAVVLYRNGESARLGTVVLIASSRTASALSTPSVRVRGPQGWADVSGAVTRQVPAAPANVQVAQAAVPSGTYDVLEVSGRQLGVKFDVTARHVTPVLLVVSGGQPAAAYGGSETVSVALNELAGRLRSLPEFHLVDQNGNVFDNRSIAGRTLILAAFHTTCTTTCPLYTGLFLDLQRRVPRDVMLVEASTDPVHDTPEALRSYAAKVGARWRFVTGTAEELRAFWQPLDVQLSGDQLHSSTMAIVDGNGFIRSVYQGVPDVGGALPAPLMDGLSPLGQQELHSHGDGWGSAQVLGSLRDVNSIVPHEASGQGGAPDFAATDLDGHPVSLAQFRGRPLLVNFWASWCVPCRTELPLLQRASDRSPSLAIMLVDERDDAGAARQFLRGLHVRLPVASDPDGSIGARYRVAGLPATFFVRADGSIASSRLGQLDESTLEEHLRAIGAI
jgi:cytochrome c biogenesis protein CcmG, thiol:disulfide interchange protein DsbE